MRKKIIAEYYQLVGEVDETVMSNSELMIEKRKLGRSPTKAAGLHTFLKWFEEQNCFASDRLSDVHEFVFSFRRVMLHYTM